MVSLSWVVTVVLMTSYSVVSDELTQIRPHQRGLGSDSIVYDIGTRRPEKIFALSPSEASEIGLAEDGAWVLISLILFGNVLALDVDPYSPSAGTLVELVDPGTSFLQRPATGLSYYDGFIIACGGGFRFGVLPFIYFYNATTGDLALSCLPEGAGFINDVYVEGDKGYFTDSNTNNLYEIDLMGSLSSDSCLITNITLSDNFAGVRAGPTQANGIVGFAGGLFIAHTTEGAVYFLDLEDLSTTLVVPMGEVPGVDGLAIGSLRRNKRKMKRLLRSKKEDKYYYDDDDEVILYATSNSLDRISAYKVSVAKGGGIEAILLGQIVSEEFDNPPTSAVIGNYIWTVNARFSTLPPPYPGEAMPATFNETFQVVGLNRFQALEGEEEEEERMPKKGAKKGMKGKKSPKKGSKMAKGSKSTKGGKGKDDRDDEDGYQV